MNSFHLKTHQNINKLFMQNQLWQKSNFCFEEVELQRAHGCRFLRTLSEGRPQSNLGAYYKNATLCKVVGVYSWMPCPNSGTDYFCYWRNSWKMAIHRVNHMALTHRPSKLVLNSCEITEKFKWINYKFHKSWLIRIYLTFIFVLKNVNPFK